MTEREIIKEVIKMLSEIRDSHYVTYGRIKTALFNSKAINAFNFAISALKKQEQDRWIPVTERLPEAEYGEGDTVLTTCTHRNAEDGDYKWVRLLYFNGGAWCYPTGEVYERKVIAWRPLPEPYQEENDE